MARYPAGIRYSNSETYDEATDRVNEFGDTIFIQKRPDGTPTGRESVVIAGNLYGAEIAGQIHVRHMSKAAPLLLALCERVASLNRNAGEIGAGMLASLVDEARAAVAAAKR